MKLTDQQQAIINAVKTTNDNILIRARAGCGKTSTLVEVSKVLSCDHLFVAFNKSIAEELKLRGVPASTVHALAYKMCLKGRKLNDGKVYFHHYKGRTKKVMPLYFIKNVLHAAQMDLVRSVEDFEVWLDENEKTVKYYYEDYKENNTSIDDDGNIVDKSASYKTALKEFIQFFESYSKDVDNVTFDDLIVDLATKRITNKIPVVLYDEAQDSNKAFLSAIINVADRLIIVGDDKQTIYEFLGASEKRFNSLVYKLNALEFPLTKTFRCASSIVEVAQEFVPDFEGMRKEEGVVDFDDIRCESEEFPQKAVERAPLTCDAYICGTNITCLMMVIKLNHAGINAFLMGKMLKAKLEYISSYNSWEDIKKELELLKKVPKEKLTIGLSNQITRLNDALRLENTGATLQTIKNYVLKDNGKVPVTTVHVSKGLEWHKVCLIEEKNLTPNMQYVGRTRAKDWLTLIRKVENV